MSWAASVAASNVSDPFQFFIFGLQSSYCDKICLESFAPSTFQLSPLIFFCTIDQPHCRVSLISNAQGTSPIQLIQHPLKLLNWLKLLQNLSNSSEPSKPLFYCLNWPSSEILYNMYELTNFWLKTLNDSGAAHCQFKCYSWELLF